MEELLFNFLLIVVLLYLPLYISMFIIQFHLSIKILNQINRFNASIRMVLNE